MLATIHFRLYAALIASFCVLGLCLAFAQPVFSIPDEPAHWLTANVRLERLFGREGCVPTVFTPPCPRKAICSAIPKLQLTCNEDSGVYGDVFTYPGVLLAKVLLPRQTESAIRQIQGIVLSRLLQGLLVALALLRAGMLARKTRRVGIVSLGAFTLSPLLAQQAFGVSADGAQLALGVCLFSALMFWEALSVADVVLFLCLGYASTAKPTMLPLILPSMLAAFWFRSVEQRPHEGLLAHGRALWSALRPTRSPSAGTALLWSALVISALTIVFALIEDAKGQAGANAEENLSRVTHLQELRDNPLLVFDLVAHLRYDPRKAMHWVGPLGWLDLWLSQAVVNAFLRILALAFGLELLLLAWLGYRQRSELTGALRRFRLVLPALTLGVLGPLVNVLFMTGLMYVLWTPLGVHTARGVQLRYFFPASMVSIALLFRTLSILVPTRLSDRSAAAQRGARWLALGAPCLVLALSLPYIARLFVDVSLRYHDPERYEAP